MSTSAFQCPGTRGDRQFTAGAEVGTGRSHGKAILLGEHAVVYGAPALAVPVAQLAATATAVRFPGAGEVSFTMTGSAFDQVVTQANDSLRQLVARFFETTGVPGTPRVDVLVDCAIRPGRGLGSSAACARAVVHALADLFDRELTGSEVFDLVQTAEKLSHGRASGVDAVATGATGPVLFTGGAVRTPLVGLDAVLVVADSGVPGRTKDAVRGLAESFERQPGARQRFVDAVTALTDAAVADLAAGRAVEFGARMTACHGLLAEQGLSTELIDDLVRAALAAGGLGAKISGGGLGGCLIALAADPDAARAVRTALHDAGATGSWLVPVRKGSGDDR